jgi:hypothetical protein
MIDESESPMEADKDSEILKRVVQSLSGKFDTVQIIATRHDLSEADGTSLAYSGSGNWYARIGSVREFLIRWEEDSRVDVRKGRGE